MGDPAPGGGVPPRPDSHPAGGTDHSSLSVPCQAQRAQPRPPPHPPALLPGPPAGSAQLSPSFSRRSGAVRRLLPGRQLRGPSTACLPQEVRGIQRCPPPPCQYPTNGTRSSGQPAGPTGGGQGLGAGRSAGGRGICSQGLWLPPQASAPWWGSCSRPTPPHPFLLQPSGRGGDDRAGGAHLLARRAAPLARRGECCGRLRGDLGESGCGGLCPGAALGRQRPGGGALCWGLPGLAGAEDLCMQRGPGGRLSCTIACGADASGCKTQAVPCCSMLLALLWLTPARCPWLGKPLWVCACSPPPPHLHGACRLSLSPPGCRGGGHCAARV